MRAATVSASARADDRLDEHRELVAAEAGHRVAGADRVAQPVGDLDQQLVAGGVAEAVVDLLEAVEVQEQDRHVVGAAAAVQRLLEPLPEQRAVGQLGEAVVVRLVDQLVLQLLARR